MTASLAKPDRAAWIASEAQESYAVAEGGDLRYFEDLEVSLVWKSRKLLEGRRRESVRKVVADQGEA